MTIPRNFKFSASNLQDYLDCPRRFELRYLLYIDWPAVENEPVLEREHFIQQGKAFHHAVHQYLIGIPSERIIPTLMGSDLLQWWSNFSIHNPHLWFEGIRMPEFKVNVPLAGYQFTGQFDLLVHTSENKTIIFDWKTSTSKPNPSFLRKKIQSRLYPLMLSIVSRDPGKPLTCNPEDISLIYWFPGSPESTLTLTYSTIQMKEDIAFFTRLIDEISITQPGDFLLTLEENRCLYCRYRSLCDRGISGGDWKKSEDYLDMGMEAAIDIDLDSIEEIEY